jgi:hypothetical protein
MGNQQEEAEQRLIKDIKKKMIDDELKFLNELKCNYNCYGINYEKIMERIFILEEAIKKHD